MSYNMVCKAVRYVMEANFYHEEFLLLGLLIYITTRYGKGIWNEPRHDKTNKMSVRPESLLPHEEALGPWLSFECTAKTLIRLGRCPGWSESSLSAHSFCWFCHVVAQMSLTTFFLSQSYDHASCSLYGHFNRVASLKYHSLDTRHETLPSYINVSLGKQSNSSSKSTLLAILSTSDGHIYRNDPKFLDRQVWANSADPD